MTQLNPRCDKQHLSLPRFQQQRPLWPKMFFLMHVLLLRTTTHYIFVIRRTLLCQLCSLCIPMIPYVNLCNLSTRSGTLHSAQAAASSSELPRSLIAAQSHSQKPRGSNVRPRHLPRFRSMKRAHGTSYRVACSMPSD